MAGPNPLIFAVVTLSGRVIKTVAIVGMAFYLVPLSRDSNLESALESSHGVSESPEGGRPIAQGATLGNQATPHLSQPCQG